MASVLNDPTAISNPPNGSSTAVDAYHDITVEGMSKAFGLTPKKEQGETRSLATMLRMLKENRPMRMPCMRLEEKGTLVEWPIHPMKQCVALVESRAMVSLLSLICGWSVAVSNLSYPWN